MTRDSGMSAEARVRLALECAAKHCISVDGPFNIVTSTSAGLASALAKSEPPLLAKSEPPSQPHLMASPLVLDPARLMAGYRTVVQ